MNRLINCSGCCNLVPINNHRSVACRIFRLRTMAPQRGHKCIAYNYHTEPCTNCKVPIEVDNPFEWGWDETRTKILCKNCLQVDVIPTGRRT